MIEEGNAVVLGRCSGIEGETDFWNRAVTRLLSSMKNLSKTIENWLRSTTFALETKVDPLETIDPFDDKFSIVSIRSSLI